MLEQDEAVARMLNEHEIQATLSRHCQGLDRLDEAALAGTYHPDAIECHGAFSGPASEWRASMLSKIPQAYERIRHTVSTINISWDGPVAYVESSFTAECVLRESSGHPMLKCTYGRYLDRFEQGADGGWRIAERTVVKDYGDVRAVRDPGPDGVFPLSQYGPADLLYARDSARPRRY